MARAPSDIKAEITQLEAMRKKRLGKPGFAANVAAIDERLAECNAELEAA